MKKIGTGLIILMTFCCSNISSQAKINKERSYEETLQEFLDVTGINQNGLSQISKMTSTFGGLNNIKGEELELTMEAILDKFLVDLIPIYKANYSQDTLEELTFFFKSPLGEKYITTNRKIAIETLQMSTEMSMEIVKEMTKGLGTQKEKEK